MKMAMNQTDHMLPLIVPITADEEDDTGYIIGYLIGILGRQTEYKGSSTCTFAGQLLPHVAFEKLNRFHKTYAQPTRGVTQSPPPHSRSRIGTIFPFPPQRSGGFQAINTPKDSSVDREKSSQPQPDSPKLSFSRKDVADLWQQRLRGIPSKYK